MKEFFASLAAIVTIRVINLLQGGKKNFLESGFFLVITRRVK